MYHDTIKTSRVATSPHNYVHCGTVRVFEKAGFGTIAFLGDWQNSYRCYAKNHLNANNKP